MGDQNKSYMPAKNDLSMFVTPVSEPDHSKESQMYNRPHCYAIISIS